VPSSDIVLKKYRPLIFMCPRVRKCRLLASLPASWYTLHYKIKYIRNSLTVSCCCQYRFDLFYYVSIMCRYKPVRQTIARTRFVKQYFLRSYFCNIRTSFVHRRCNLCIVICIFQIVSYVGFIFIQIRLQLLTEQCRAVSITAPRSRL